MPIRPPTLRTVSARRKPVASPQQTTRKRGPRRNPSPFWWERDIEAVPESLGADLKIIFDAMVPHFRANLKIIAGWSRMKQPEEERAVVQYREHLLEMSAMLMYASGLVNAHLHLELQEQGHDADDIRSFAASHAKGVHERVEFGDDDWRLWTDILAEIGPAVDEQKYLDSAIRWVASVASGKHPEVRGMPLTAAVYYETMLLMTLAMYDDNQWLRRSSVKMVRPYTVLMSQDDWRAWIMMLKKLQEPEVERFWEAVFQAGSDRRRMGTNGEQWAFGDADTVFVKRYGRLPFPPERIVGSIREQFDAGYVGMPRVR